MSEQAKPTTGKAILILVGWSLLACVLSQLAAVFGSGFVSIFAWVSILLAGAGTYREIRPMRYTFLILALAPIIFYAISWLILLIWYFGQGS